MNDPATPPSPDPHGRIGHETTDVSPLAVVQFALGLTLMLALVFPLLAWIFWRFDAAARRSDAPQSHSVGDQAPPPPLLQQNAAADLVLFRLREGQRLSSYGWVDSRQRVVRIPIDRAIEVLSQRGLPEPAGSPDPAAKVERAP